MEHEFDKIKSKVLEAEQNSVTWEKELVWSKIRQPERKNFAFYYAAASLLIASALFFYAYEITKQKKIELQLKVIELSIEKNKTLQAGVDEQHFSREAIVCPEMVVSQPSLQQKIRKSGHKKLVLPIIEEQQMQDKEMNTVAVLDEIVTPLETPATIVESTPMKQVHAIIGSSAQSTSRTKDKKLKFRLFLSEENTERVPAAAETISFHSKIN